jgi:hypothetical protein
LLKEFYTRRSRSEIPIRKVRHHGAVPEQGAEGAHGRRKLPQVFLEIRVFETDMAAA